MNHISLFSGIGGFDLAGLWTWGEDFYSIAHSEIEKFPCKVYHRHFPESECLGDITKIDWTRFKGRVDLLTGGFPCQPHSIAGKRKGSKDERDLWGECVRALSGIRPRYAVFENVPGIITSEHGKTWERIKMDLEACGYKGIPLRFRAADVGAPHGRRRVWIVCYSRECGFQGESWRWSGKKFEDRYLELDTFGDTNGGDRDEGAEQEVGRGQNSKPTRSDQCTQHFPHNTSDDGLSVANTKIRQISPNTIGNGLQRIGQESDGKRSFGLHGGENPDWSTNWIEVATALCRMDDGLPRQLDRVQRLKALGNAIVPQCAQVIFEAIKEMESSQ